MPIDVKLPELAEGVTKGDIVNVMVKEGDTIDVDTPLIEVESDKATLPVPSAVKGKVTKVLVKAGEKISVGQVFLQVEAEGEASAQPQAKAEAPKSAVEAPKAKADDKKSAAPSKPQPAAAPPKPLPQAPVRAPGEVIPAGPAVRRIARELGIDLGVVQGSGNNGRIRVEDLDPYVRGFVAQRGGNGAPGVGHAIALPELPDFSKFGPVRRERADSLRRKIAEKMSQSWSSVAHVHQFADADITDLLALRERHKDRVKAEGGALTLTVFAIKAAAHVLKEFPQFNATYDAANQEIIYKDYYHIGVAVDTPNGLIVPVLRDVDKKSIVQLSVELQELAQKTRDRKTSLDDLRGGTFTISNLGGIGGTHFTPIVNTPEVAIMGIGRSQRRPTYAENGEIVGRDICPICIGYDHRIVDGADGARFTVRLTEILENFEATFLGF